MNGASGIGWSETDPADTESAGLADDRMRSIKTSVRQSLDDEHNFPSSGGNNVGYHRYGSARAYVGTQSRVSSSGTEGRLMVTSDTSRLFGVGSGGTVLLGAGPTSLSLGSTYGQTTFPQRSHWVEEIGDGVLNSSGTTQITFPNSGYSGQPRLWLQVIAQSATAIGGGLTLLSYVTEGKTTASVFGCRSTDGSNSNVSGVYFVWRSLGTRAL